MDDALSYSENASSSSDLAVSNKNLFKDTQIWILSEFGKPIFSSCGRECELSSTFALIQALVMRYESWKDSLLSIQMTNLYIQFSYRSPLIVCIVSHQPYNLNLQLDIVYNQVLSIMTKFTLKSFFEKMGENYDMRRWLKDIDQRVNACAKGFNEDPVVFLSGFRILPLHPPDRDYIVSTLGTIINQYSPNNVVFGMLVAHRQLVALVRMKKLNLTPSDFNTIVSMIECHESQLKEGGSWVPTCLPVFDSNSYLHAYISFLWDGAGPCLILLSVSPTVETFGELSTVRVKFEENMCAYKRYNPLKSALLQPGDPLKQPMCVDLWHFIYKNTVNSQICCMSPQKPYISYQELSSLHHGYFKVTNLLRRVKERNEQKIKMFFFTTERCSLFTWIAPNIELHCTFSPLVTQAFAMETAEKILKIMRKDEKRVFFNVPPGVLLGG